MNAYHEHYPRLYQSLARAEAKFPELLATNYQRILVRVELLWGTKGAVNYLDSLFLGDSSEDRPDRQGFPMEVLKEIVLLKQMHDFLFPSIEVNPYDPFSGYSSAAPAKDKAVPRAAAATTSDTAPSTTALPLAAAHSAGAHSTKEHDVKHIAWPLISTQRELIVCTENRHRRANVYAQQGKPVEEILVQYGCMDERTLHVVQRMQERPEHKGKALGQILVGLGIISHDELARALCIQAGVLMVDILGIIIPFKTIKTVPNPKAREKQAVPVGIYQDILFLAVADPLGFNDHQFFTTLTGYKINPVFAPRHEIVNRLNMYN